jgi:hypothetical protein
MLMLQRLIDHMKERDGISFSAMGEVAREWKRAHPLDQMRGTR